LVNSASACDDATDASLRREAQYRGKSLVCAFNFVGMNARKG
jgi:hypothetical protein